MTASDRVRWDAIYRETRTFGYPDPDPLLFEYAPPASLGAMRRALDLAGGLGQNALWLATQGYIVDLVDVSRVALETAQDAAHQRGIERLNVLQIDLDHDALESEAYDLVCVFRFLKRELFPMIRGAVRPGGRVIYETYNTRYLDVLPGFNADFLLETGELAGYFGDWQIVRNTNARHISQLVAVKPHG